ncbi:MAG: class II glutamine amidotransferase [Vampirovibrio sp.]|nr:class II glutamine amidotransferase [Vampirovibrio sp.]
MNILFHQKFAFLKVIQLTLTLALLLGLSLPSFACRLLLIIQNQPDAVDVQERFITGSRSLRNQAQTESPWFQLAGQSVKNNFYGSSDQNHDGFGVVAFGKDPADTVYKRNVNWIQSSESSKQLAEIVDATAKTTHTYLGHIRAASPNTSVDEENNHPYKVVRNENETWYFMANGGIAVPPKAYEQKLKKNPWLSTYASKAPLPSDSEYLFHWLLADVNKVLGGTAYQVDEYNSPLVEESLRLGFAKLLAQQPLVTYQPSDVETAEIPVNRVYGQSMVRAIGKTWMLSNGEYTYVAIYNNDVWMQVKKDDKGALQTVVIASEPTNLAEFYKAGERFKAGWSRWQQLPNNTLFTIHRALSDGNMWSKGDISIDTNSFDAPAVKVPKGLCPKAKVNEIGC